jgi:hypothetical protein
MPLLKTSGATKHDTLSKNGFGSGSIFYMLACEACFVAAAKIRSACLMQVFTLRSYRTLNARALSNGFVASPHNGLWEPFGALPFEL